MNNQPLVLLVDNGSLRVESYHQLQRLAGKVQELIGKQTAARPLQHVENIPETDLNGSSVPAFSKAMQQWIKRGTNHFIIIPFFFGPSRAITGLLMQQLKGLKNDFPLLKVQLAPCLCDPAETIYTISQIMSDGILTTIKKHNIEKAPNVIVVDHGSPLKTIADIRNRIASEVKLLLKDKTHTTTAASMERRPGDDYAFNEPLLGSALKDYQSSRPLIIAKQFLLPGRHAGKNGDVDQIVQENLHNEAICYGTDLLAYHPSMPYLLKERYLSALKGDSIV